MGVAFCSASLIKVIAVNKAQGSINKAHLKVVVGSAEGVVKVSGAPALTISLS